jgi:alkylated DNA repair dioxygenase AlkB
LSDQFSLFAKTPLGPDGLRYDADFVTSAEEHRLMAEVASLPLTPFQFGQYKGKRRVASFGFSYDYTARRLVEAEPIPDWLADVSRRVEAFGGPGTRIRQVLCTEYDVGVGIGWHRDKPHFDRIFGLSLGAACKFRFRRPAASKFERLTIEAAPRSVYMMSGEARSAWEHSIPAVEAKRYSITFRTMADPARREAESDIDG